MKIKIWVVNLLLIIIIGIIVIMFLHNKKRIGVVNKEFKVNEFKESNRVEAIIENLKRAGVKSAYKNGDLIIEGNKSYIDKSLEIESFKDHRIALAFLVLSLKNKKHTLIKDYECTEISFPNSLTLFNLDYDLI